MNAHAKLCYYSAYSKKGNKVCCLFKVWLSICQLDSDGDGRTNGEELGDPDCVWSKNGETNVTNGELSHPGNLQQIILTSL